jgi:hypothetical protein
MCCGRARPRPSVYPGANPPQRSTSYVETGGPIFEYVGRTALTVTGPVSGGRYRFDRAGSRQQVDARDRAALANIPVLRAVS